MSVGERIKAIRFTKGLTQQAFADKLGLKRNTVGSYEIDAVAPSGRTISDICREFGVDEVWLRTGEGEPFRKITQKEEIMQFAAQTATGSDEFRKAFVATLAKLDANDWLKLAELFKKFNQEINKGK